MRSKTDNTETKKKKKKRKNPFRFFVYDFVKVTGALTAFLFVRPKRLYESDAAKKKIKKRAVVISNHLGVLDPVVMHFAFPYRRMHFLALQEIFGTRMGNWFFRQMQCIPVDRENFRMDTFRQSVDVLDDEAMLCIFPEGAINTAKNTVNAFKSGAVLIAMRGHAPVVPVYMAPRDKWYKRTVLVIGEPIDPYACGDGKTLASLDAVTAQLHEKEIKLMELYNQWKHRKSSK